MYAGRKRRKPVQRAVKQAPAEGAKSNPSKRHRDRLNGELERLASLLPFPEEVTTSLDKLSILRLSVSYLRAKNFFSVALQNHTSNRVPVSGGDEDNGSAPGLTDTWLSEGELLLQALNGFVLVVTADGTIFYSSHTIQDYLGFHQTDVMHQSVYDLVHTEDQQELRRNLHWALNPPPATVVLVSQDSTPDIEPDSSAAMVTYKPEQLPPENSSFLERSFVCRFRCLLDNSSGFLALNLQGRLKFLHGQNQRQDNGGKVPPQLALFTIATPLQPPSILEIRTKNMIFRTKHKLDFTPMACDAKGKIVLGYTEAELRVRGSGYQFIHAADMLYCAENHVRMMKTGESGLTVFRLLTKDNRWKWVQANARLVYKNGKPDYIIATQRPLVEEEGGEHLRKRSMHLPFTFATGEALLYQSNHPIAGSSDGVQGSEKNGGRSKKGRTDRASRDGLDPGSLLGSLMSQDESVYVCQPALESKLSFHSSLFGDRGSFADPDPSAMLLGWDEPNNRVVEPGLPELGPSFDPLLATLDSLSLGGPVADEENREGCSNGELFGALEGLGLSAEDLELLLLDERMIRVEMDPERPPSLDDLLSNDEILSYIHDSLESKTEPMEDGGSGSCSVIPPATSTTTIPSASESSPAPAPGLHSAYPLHRSPLLGPSPILQLSQQMQQHLNMRPGKVVQDWDQHSNLLAHPAANGLRGQNQNQTIHTNGQWSAQAVLASSGIQVDQCHTQQQTLSNRKLDGGLPQQPMHQHYLQQQQLHQPHRLPSQLPPRQIRQNGANLNGLCSIQIAGHPAGKQQWQNYSCSQPVDYNTGSRVESTPSNPCLSNGHVTGRTHAAISTCADYSVPDISGMDFTINGGTYGGNGGPHHCGGEAGVATYQRITQKQLQHEGQPLPPPLAQVLSSLAQGPPPNATLEQILGAGVGVGQPYAELPSLDSYGMVSAAIPNDPDHNKMENGCIVSTTFPTGCVLPNGNPVVPSNGQLSCPETLSSLPDSQTTGFYL
ncbi:aryl hydrocarbon receptor-like isoform X3 [Hypomesus transpacificus]|nr:aryl hydrocarbon receptor-like isoform X3 [Hypomesus transpacificus]